MRSQRTARPQHFVVRGCSPTPPHPTPPHPTPHAHRWNRACDEALLRGAVKWGARPHKDCVGHILSDPDLGFYNRVRQDPAYRVENGAGERA